MTEASNWFARLAFAASVLALAVIVLGAYVRLSDAGLGCPDWPGCYGRVLAPTAAHELEAAAQSHPGRPIDAAKAWKEMVHRYLAAVLGTMIVVIVAAALKRPRIAGVPRIAAFALVSLLIVQGALGMLTVTWLLKPVIVVAHLLGGLSILALLWWITLRTSIGLNPAPTEGRPDVRFWCAAALFVLILQIALGGWTSSNYAALACTDFPTCQGRWWPEMNWTTGFTLWHGLGINYEFGVLESPARTAVHVAHRLGACLALTVLAALAIVSMSTRSRTVRTCGVLLLVALSIQISLGIANVLLGLPMPTAVAHTGVAAVLLLTVVTLLHLSTPQTPTNSVRSPRAETHATR